MTQAQAHSGHSSKIKADAVNDYKAQKGFVISKPNKSNQRGSMKGKKVIVRLKASQFDITSAMEGELPKSSPLSHPQKSDFFLKNWSNLLPLGRNIENFFLVSARKLAMARGGLSI